MKTSQKKYSRPIELLIATYNNFNLLPINDFIEQIQYLSINADYGIIKLTILKEETLMGIEKRVLKRLHDLDEILNIEYDKLTSFQKSLAYRSDPAVRFQLEQQIMHECLPNIRKYESEYVQILFNEFPFVELSESDAEGILEEFRAIFEAIQTDQEAIKNNELTKLISEAKHQLDQPGKVATAKLKATIPIIPGLLKYEMELDTESTVIMIWKRIKSILRINK